MEIPGNDYAKHFGAVVGNLILTLDGSSLILLLLKKIAKGKARF